MKRVLATVLGAGLLLAGCGQNTPTATASPGAPVASYGDGLDHSWTASTAEGQRLYAALAQGLKAQDFNIGLSVTATSGWGPIELNTSNGETPAGDGKPITLNGKVYSTGLGLHANSEIHIHATNLETPACTRFQADVGLDDEVGDKGSVVFQVFADGVKLFDSGVMTGASATQHIDVGIGNKSDLRFVVTDAGDNDYYDHADWAGASLSCVAPISSGTVVAWGFNGYGQTTVPAGLTHVTAIAAGQYHNLVVTTDGTVRGWGDNTDGQLDIPADLTGVQAVSAGFDHSLALKNDGTVVAWGDNTFGQLNIPAGLAAVKAIAAGSVHNVALKTDGTVVGWGLNGQGDLNIPEGLTGVKAIAAGDFHTLALKGDGTVIGWGYDAFGAVTIPEGLINVTAISANGYHSLALKADGTVVAWGSNRFGESSVPNGLTNVVAISAGSDFSLALKMDGTVVGWGLNDSAGELNIPTDLTGVKAIAAGSFHSLALR